MSAILMAQRKATTTLTVLKEDQEIVAKIARMRGVSIERLFAEHDVREFFTHLLLGEVQKEAERLQEILKK